MPKENEEKAINFIQSVCRFSTGQCSPHVLVQVCTADEKGEMWNTDQATADENVHVSQGSNRIMMSAHYIIPEDS